MRTPSRPHPGLHPLRRTGARGQRALLAGIVVLALVHVTVLSWPHPGPPVRPLWSSVADLLGAVGVVVVILRRGWHDAGTRRMWWYLGTAVAAYLTGSALSAVAGQGGPLSGLRLGAYAGWSCFYLLAYASVVTLLRQRVERFHASMWLDGLITALAVGALVVALLLGPLVDAGASAAALVRTFAFPVADLLVLMLLAGVLAVIGRRTGRAVLVLAGGVAAFALTDVVWAVQTSQGTYVEGGLLDLGWVLAQSSLAVAACLPLPDGPARRWEGLGVLAVPGAAAAAALVLLLVGTLVPVPRLAAWLALGTLTGVLVRTALTFREVRALAESRRQARTDELTGLANRRRFSEALAAETTPGRPWRRPAVLMVDLDRFKDINDSLGHSTGDHLLRLVALRLDGAVPVRDLLARLGGDEFAVLLRTADPTTAQALAQRLHAALQEPFVLRGVSLTVEASVGVAAPAHRVDADEVMQMADVAMYAAKSRRTGTHVYDEGRDGQDRHRLELVEQLRAGIERGELVLHYQPKVHLADGRVRGLEALVRWQHPVRGLMAPDDFIDVAESAGLMAGLTTTVLDQALAQVARWRAEGVDLQVAVNVSPWNLMDAAFPDHVAALLQRHGVPSASLVLEVTETSLMEDPERAVAVLTRLRGAGTTIAVDDYGSGYSSLAYLAELPIDELKLDRRFVSTMTQDTRTAAIVTSTVQLAHALGLVLVAEGVEDAEVLAALAREGCDTAQGHHLGRPVPADLVPAVCASAEHAAGARRRSGSPALPVPRQHRPEG